MLREEYELLENKAFAFRCFYALIEYKVLTETDIYTLTDKDECKRLFSCSGFPILLEVSNSIIVSDADCCDDSGRQRFYREKINCNGRAFLITNHWYGPNKSMPDNRTPFLTWVLKRIN